MLSCYLNDFEVRAFCCQSYTRAPPPPPTPNLPHNPHLHVTQVRCASAYATSLLLQLQSSAASDVPQYKVPIRWVSFLITCLPRLPRRTSREDVRHGPGGSKGSPINDLRVEYMTTTGGYLTSKARIAVRSAWFRSWSEVRAFLCQSYTRAPTSIRSAIMVLVLVLVLAESSAVGPRDHATSYHYHHDRRGHLEHA
ncbi:hypothetical protein BV22DRAFT_841259 [Leucogyrophana mollusca]|uniref:Uncharacterized protein n=1 Tax=Leucogyrophana mollusca TaxID=85980 RepID=A0ACB8B449_9AGAM|nr:hypothetical protein BV22DRAFT_841259 [Leucogyrophana mollusca]